jgi:hypothetical protein
MWRRLPVHNRILVSLRGENRAITGVLLRTTGPYLVLGDAELHETSVKTQPMDGEIYIHRDRVSFIQAAKGG